MPIKFQCPTCKRGLSARDEMAGKKSQCPQCKTVLVVPSLRNGASAPAAPPDPARRRAPAPPPAPAGSAPPAPPPSASPEPPSSPPLHKPPPGPAAGPAGPSAPVIPPTRPPARPAVRTSQPEPAAAPPPPPAADGAGPVASEPTADTGPPRSAEEIEDQAAALLSDGSAAQGEQPTFIDFPCPYCDEKIQMALDLAGKKAPCPQCRRIIKVPEPARSGPRDWRQAERIPAGARRPDQPAPEGAWGSQHAGRVGAEALLEAGVLKVPERPRTTWQKIWLPVTGAVVVLLGIGTTLFVLHRLARDRQQQALDRALTYAAQPAAAEQIGGPGQAALYLGAGTYYRRLQKPGCAAQAREQYGQALQALRDSSGSERDLVLTELAVEQIDLAGTADEARMELRSGWPDTLRFQRAALEAIRSPQGRLEALRGLCAPLLSHGQGEYIVPLVSQLYSKPNASRAEAFSVVGLQMLASGERPLAYRALEQALAVYQGEKPAELRAAVVTLAMALKKELPSRKERPSAGERREQHIGEAGGLARQGQWDQARQLAARNSYGPQVRLRALLAVARAAVDEHAGTSDVEALLHAVVSELPAVLRVETDPAERDRFAWELLQVVRLGQQAGLPAELLAAVPALIPDTGLRGWAQLDLLRPRLAADGSGIEEASLEALEGRSLARLLARELWACYHTRRDTGWARTVASWPEPQQAFGSLGVALGLQERDRGS